MRTSRRFQENRRANSTSATRLERQASKHDPLPSSKKNGGELWRSSERDGCSSAAGRRGDGHPVEKLRARRGRPHRRTGNRRCSGLDEPDGAGGGGTPGAVVQDEDSAVRDHDCGGGPAHAVGELLAQQVRPLRGRGLSGRARPVVGVGRRAQPHGRRGRHGQRRCALPGPWPGSRWRVLPRVRRRRRGGVRSAGRRSRTAAGSENRGANSAATWSARRVLPTPPTPVNVTSRDARAAGPRTRISRGATPRLTCGSVERTTGFEPATPTLARLCSTN